MERTDEGTHRPLAEEITGSLGRLPSTAGLGAGFEGGGTVVPVVPPEALDAVGPEPKPIALGAALLYSSGNFGAGIFYALNNFALEFFLKPLGAGGILYGLLANQRSFEGSIIQPIVGAWSDRTWHRRFGRRRPFIVAFLPLSVLFLVLTPFLPRFAFLGQSFGWTDGFTALALASLGIFLFSTTFNIQIDPYNTMLADITPVRQRGTVNGIFQAIGAAGQVMLTLVGIFVVKVYGVTPLFIFTAAALVVFFLPTILGIREPRRLHGVAAHVRHTVRDYWRALKADRQVQLFFANQAFLWFGIAVITPFITKYGSEGLHFDDGTALSLALVLLLSSSIFVWPLGVLSDRFGLKRIFLLGMICMAGASLAAIFIKDLYPLYGLLALAGLGNAAQTASSYPLLTRMVLPEKMGLYTGLHSSVTSVFAPLAGLAAGALWDTIGPDSLFPLIATAFLVALIPLALIRVERSEAGRMRAARAAEVN